MNEDAHINIFEEFTNHPLPDVDRVRAVDTDFVIDLVEAGNLVNKFLAITAALVPDISLDKLQQGVLFGHIVRMYKLYDSFLLLVNSNRSDTAYLVARTLTDNSIKLKYLISNIDDNLCKKFIKSSLAYDKKLLDFIQSKLNGREPLPFEKRIIESIKKTFSEAKYNIKDINFNKDKEWHENLFDLSSRVGLLDYYETMYRGGSRAEHGSWSHLKNHHLIEKEAGFEPQLGNIEPHPLLIITTNLICLSIMLDYLKFIQPHKKTFLTLIEKVIAWHSKLNENREQFINQNYGDSNLF